MNPVIHSSEVKYVLVDYFREFLFIWDQGDTFQTEQHSKMNVRILGRVLSFPLHPTSASLSVEIIDHNSQRGILEELYDNDLRLEQEKRNWVWGERQFVQCNSASKET